MPRSLFALCLLAAAFAWPPARAGALATDGEALSAWWRAAAELSLGDTAYRAAGVHFEDGVCSAEFTSGVFIPVWSGRPPASERVVGVIFVGEGTLSVRFPQRADAWSFAAWRQRRLGASRESVAAIAEGGAPYTAPITRALLLSADEKVRDVLLDLKPIGAGSVLSKTEAGIDETYVVTEDRGSFGATLVATNLLPGRLLQLQRDGLDATAFVRQDRLLHEELGVSGAELRLVADFRTTDRFGVAEPEGSVLGPQDHDQWMTCFRDGLGQSDTGFQSMAFSHGTDSEQRRHFQRWSGEPFVRAVGQPGPEPRRWMAPISADTTVKLLPNRGGRVQQVEVSSLLTVEARGGPGQALGLRLPTAGSVVGSWEMVELSNEDGRTLPWVGLSSDLAGEGLLGGPGEASVIVVTTEDRDAVSEAGQLADSARIRDPFRRPGQLATYDPALIETDAVAQAKTRTEILAVLLRFQLGDQAFLQALDRLAKRRAGQRITTEQLQEAFEESAERDLGDFFDTWVHGGLVPRLRAEVSLRPGPTGTTVSGCLSAEPVWGRYEVPLVITDQHGGRSVQALVSVRDGVGRFSLEGRDDSAAVQIDPDGLVLAYSREVHVVGGVPDCQ